MRQLFGQGLGTALARAETPAPRIPTILVFGVWLGLAVLGAATHEIGKDEGRALLLALSADSLWAVPAAIQGEGHPALWYVLLRAAHMVWNDTVVLQILGVGLTATGIYIFLSRAPLPLWWKLLFAFSGLPLYEYSVVPRNYGISLLILFLICLVLPDRKSSPLLLGGLLFALAQTNVHSALLVPFLGAVWLWDHWWRDGRPHIRIDAPVILIVGLMAIGLLAAVLTVYPPRHTGVTDAMAQSYFRESYIKTLAIVILEPGHFYRILTGMPALTATIVVYVATFGLLRWPILLLAALGGLWSSALFFALVYNGGYRHQGLWFIYLIALYWIGIVRNRREEHAPLPWLMLPYRIALYGALPLLLLINCVTGYENFTRDFRVEVSKSRALGAVIDASPTLRNAIIVAEPDELNEALGYYIDNTAFLLREQKYGRVATWSAKEQGELTLGQIFARMKMLRQETGRPVIAVLFVPVVAAQAGTVFPLWWGRQFTYSAEDARAFLAATRELPLGTPSPLEDFHAYLLE